jgi:hypothetical protein
MLIERLSENYRIASCCPFFRTHYSSFNQLGCEGLQNKHGSTLKTVVWKISYGIHYVKVNSRFK